MAVEEAAPVPVSGNDDVAVVAERLFCFSIAVVFVVDCEPVDDPDT